jgi:hypothetical protein
MMLGKCKKL